MQNETISIYPDPPVHGEAMSVSTNGTIPKSLTITYSDINGVETENNLTLVEAKENTTVPASAVKMNIHDNSDQCPDVTRTF